MFEGSSFYLGCQHMSGMFKMKNQFNGSFGTKCQEESLLSHGRLTILGTVKVVSNALINSISEFLTG